MTTQIDRYAGMSTETLRLLRRQSMQVLAGRKASDARRNTHRLIVERIDIVLRSRGVTA